METHTHPPTHMHTHTNEKNSNQLKCMEVKSTVGMQTVRKVHHFGKYTYLLPCYVLGEKINTTVIYVC